MLGDIGLFFKSKADGIFGPLYWRLVGGIERARGKHGSPDRYAIIRADKSELAGAVDEYWNSHTVNQSPFKSAAQSKKYLLWRFKEYPLCREFMDLYSEHRDETILDYGCGPGDDIVGFVLFSKAKTVIGIDVSATSLDLLRHRLSLHDVSSERIKLILTSDKTSAIPLPDESVDYINSGGVLHHTSDPEAVLREFHRVLKPGSKAGVMVYHRDSLWLHLYTAYVRQILKGQFPNMSAVEAFSKNVDGVECPIARCYSSDEFLAMCVRAGFRGEFLGGYLSNRELRSWKRYAQSALSDERLGNEHREFLRQIVLDDHRMPLYKGKHAGVGGVYRLVKT